MNTFILNRHQLRNLLLDFVGFWSPILLTYTYLFNQEKLARPTWLSLKAFEQSALLPFVPFVLLLGWGIWGGVSWWRTHHRSRTPWYLVFNAGEADVGNLLRMTGMTEPLAEEIDPFLADKSFALRGLGLFVVVENSADWNELAPQLKRLLHTDMLRGTLATLGLSTLDRFHEERDQQAVIALQHNINCLGEKLGQSPPLYLILTEIDQVAGFVPFFEDWSADDRQKTWGIGLTAKQQTALHDTLKRNFDALNSNLMMRRLQRLTTGDDDSRALIFRFPSQMASKLTILQNYIIAVFNSLVLLNIAPLRGIYLVSNVGPTGYFSQSLFSRILPGDRTLTQPMPLKYRQLWQRRFALILGAGLLSLVILLISR